MAKNMPEIIKQVLAFGVIAFKTIGEAAQSTLTKTSTIVVAKLTEFCGADQSSQLYIYGIESPKPTPKTKLAHDSIAKLTEKAINKKPAATMAKPVKLPVPSLRRLKSTTVKS